MEICKEIKNIVLPHDPAVISPKYSLKDSYVNISQRYLGFKVYGSVGHNRYIMESSLLSVNRRMDKEFII